MTRGSVQIDLHFCLDFEKPCYKFSVESLICMYAIFVVVHTYLNCDQKVMSLTRVSVLWHKIWWGCRNDDLQAVGCWHRFSMQRIAYVSYSPISCFLCTWPLFLWQLHLYFLPKRAIVSKSRLNYTILSLFQTLQFCLKEINTKHTFKQ